MPTMANTRQKSANQSENLMEMLQDLSRKIDKVDDSLVSLRTEVTEIRSELSTIKEVEKSLVNTQQTVEEMQSDISLMKEDISKQDVTQNHLNNELSECKRQNKALQERLLQLDTYIRRENLKFSGISEDTNESNADTHKKIRSFFKNTLGMSEVDKIQFQRCHRMGSKMNNSKQARDIIVRFALYPDRMGIWNCKNKLKNTNFFIKEDFPILIEQRRQKIFPIFKAARDQGKKATLVADKLIIDGRQYTVENLDTLPAALQLKNISTHVMDKSVLFYGSDSPFSSFYPSTFTLDGKTFTTCEQFLQYQKALHTGENETACKILQTNEPLEQRHLGNRLKPTQDQWDNIRAEQFMEAATKAKFQQNINLKNELINTGNKLLIQFSAHDKLWGVGLNIHSIEARDKTKWKGQNLLGTILSKVREDIK